MEFRFFRLSKNATEDELAADRLIPPAQLSKKGRVGLWVAEAGLLSSLTPAVQLVADTLTDTRPGVEMPVALAISLGLSAIGTIVWYRDVISSNQDRDSELQAGTNLRIVPDSDQEAA